MEILQGIDRETEIQRYIDLSKFLDLLENKNFYMSSIAKFKDPIEGRVTILNSFFSSGAVELLDNLVNVTLPKLGKVSKTLDSSDDDDFLEKFEQRHFNTVFGEIKASEVKSFSELVNYQKTWLDVSCWHLSPNESESVAMWKIYGGLTNSIRISTTVGQLLDAIDLKESNLACSKVHYIDYKEEYFKSEHLLTPFFHKHKAYEYEREVRFITYDPKVNPLTDRKPHGTSFKFKNVNFLNEVRVSPEAPVWFFELIKNITNNRYCVNVNVRNSGLDEEFHSY